MGKRRKNIRPPIRERIKELLKVKKTREIYEMFLDTKDQISLTSIYNIKRRLKQEEISPQKPLSSPYKGEFDTTYPNVDAILLVPELDRHQKIWVLFKWPGLSFEKWKIAERVGGSLAEIQRAIEETEKELTSKTKEETKMEQESMVNLPSWVKQAQWEHLEGREQRDELGGGIDVITYPRGTSVRQELEFFKNSFSDINPRNQSFWVPKDEIVMAQLHGHLPDEAFWERVEGSEGFIKKAKECEALLDAAREKFVSAGEELAPFQPVITGPVPDVYITSGWARRVLVRALSRELGFREPDKYYPSELKDGDFILEDEEIIYRGLDTVAAEKKHRELVKGFIKSEEFPPLVKLMKDLRDLRQQILARIDQCLRGREYSYNYCPDCPADQARKMLASKRE